MMTLWEAYRLANRRRASVVVRLSEGQTIPGAMGSIVRSIRVHPRRINGFVVVNGQTADQIFVPEDQAKSIQTDRPS